MKINEKRIINSVVLTEEEQNFLLDLVNVVEDLCNTHPYSCGNCPLSTVKGCNSFKELAMEIAEKGGFENKL